MSDRDPGDETGRQAPDLMLVPNRIAQLAAEAASLKAQLAALLAQPADCAGIPARALRRPRMRIGLVVGPF